MKTSSIAFAILSLLFLSCNDKSTPIQENSTKPILKNKAHEIVYKMTQKVGTYQQLAALNDVTYTYTYETPDGKQDQSTEKYIFDGELSYGRYNKHERTLPELNGTIEQGYDGTSFWLKHNGAYLTDENLLKKVTFNRKTNFYWFTMFQKLMDDGLIYKYIKEAVVNGNKYDVVEVSFESKDGKPTDTYQLFINKETSLVDQFLFTVVDFNVVEEPMLMQMKYEKVNGLLIPTKRLYKKSTWEAEITDAPWIKVNWSNIKFNSGFEKAEFIKNATSMNNQEENDKSLKAQLDEKKAAFEIKADDEKKRIYKEGIESVVLSGILKSAKQEGQMAPNFALKNAAGNVVDLKDYLSKGMVVLTWYRGGWCPYCNLTLHELQEELPNFKANGANLLALTPEVPDKSLSTAEKHNLEFEVLSDLGNKVAKEYGIVFKLTPEVAKIYNKAFDMNGYNGDDSNELPLAATYVINQEGEIIYAFLDADYRNRAEPSDITKVLKKAN